MNLIRIIESLRTCAETEPKCRNCIEGSGGRPSLGCARRLKELAAAELERLSAANTDHN